MSIVLVGVDGCHGGWLGVIERPDGHLNAVVYRRFIDLLTAWPLATAIAVDILIGLPEVGARACDAAARKHLGLPRMCSVFPIATDVQIAPCLR